MLHEQFRELYTNYIIIRAAHNEKNYTYRAGDYFVTITADKGYNRQIRKRN